MAIHNHEISKLSSASVDQDLVNSIRLYINKLTVLTISLGYSIEFVVDGMQRAFGENGRSIFCSDVNVTVSDDGHFDIEAIINHYEVDCSLSTYSINCAAGY